MKLADGTTYVAQDMIVKMLNILDNGAESLESFEDILEYTACDGIWVFTEEAKWKLRDFVSQYPELQKNLWKAVLNIRNWYLNYDYVLREIINPDWEKYRNQRMVSLTSEAVENLCNSSGDPSKVEVQWKEPKWREPKWREPKKIKIFIVDPELWE